MLLRVLGEISVSLLCSYCSWGSGFGPASVCRSPEGVCSSLRQDGVKVAADSGALAHSFGGVGGAWNVGRTCSGRGRCDIATALGVSCVLPGKLSLDHRTLAVAGCTDSWERRCG